MTPMEFILRFTFSNPDLDTTIIGTINPVHLQTKPRNSAKETTTAGPLRRGKAPPRRCRLGASDGEMINGCNM